MGLLDKLVKEGTEILKEVATEENKEKAADLLNSLKGAFEEHKDELKQFAESFQMETKTEEYKESYFEEVDDGKDCRERILEVLANEFPQYAVKENVSPTTIGGTGRFMDYSIVVYENDIIGLDRIDVHLDRVYTIFLRERFLDNCCWQFTWFSCHDKSAT